MKTAMEYYFPFEKELASNDLKVVMGASISLINQIIEDFSREIEDLRKSGKLTVGMLAFLTTQCDSIWDQIIKLQQEKECTLLLPAEIVHNLTDKVTEQLSKFVFQKEPYGPQNLQPIEQGKPYILKGGEQDASSQICDQTEGEGMDVG